MTAVRVAGAALLLAAACAHVEPPSGGPEDETPPALLVSRPDSLAVRPDWSGPVVLVFDERISERNLQSAVQVSPRTSEVRVDHSGDELRISLARGWRPNTVYQVTVGTQLRDLFENPRTEPLRFVFSTGAPIPETRLAGTVVDPVTGKPEVETRVEAILAADSLVYAVATDSSGVYDFARIPEGEYRLRAFRDLNRNRALDPFEERDTARLTVTAGDSVGAELAVLALDSTAAQVATVEVEEGRIRVEFDDYLAPEQSFVPAQVQILSPEGRFVPVSDVDLAEQTGGAPPVAAAADAAAPAFRRPSRTLLLELLEGAEVEGGVEYRLTISRVRNLVGLTADVETTFTAPEREAPEPEPAAADTARSFLPSPKP